LFIKQIEEQQKTESGLLLNDDAVAIRYKRATVVAVGTDVSLSLIHI
jgi:co-chaperonin GroES (HSP10)